jgi:hypothetical protein
MTNSIKKLSNETIQKLTEAIQTQLLKRGFTASVALTQAEDRYGKLVFELTSETFQIRGNGGVSLDTTVPANEKINIHIGVESNGCDLFSLTAVCYPGEGGDNFEDNDGDIYQVQVSA